MHSKFISEEKQNARLRLFCFPHAGGGSSMFYPWAGILSADVHVCPVHLPGRENRLGDPPFNRLAPLVQELAQALVPYFDKPFAFLGHSMGALLSFELARKLRRQRGLGPFCLFVSACRAPQLPDKDKPIHKLPEAAFVRELLARYDGIPALVLQDPELMNLFLPVLRADLAILETYVYEPALTLDCGISVFGGINDCEVGCDDLTAWHRQTLGPFKLRMFPGDHFFLNSCREPVLRAIMEDLNELGQ